MRGLVALVLSAWLLLPGAVAAAGAGPAVGQVAEPGLTGNTTGQGVVVEIAVQESGDARWTISMRFPLATETERQAFERLAGEFRRGDADLGVSVSLFRRLADEAQTATGREMAVVDPVSTASVTNGTAGLNGSGVEATGVLAYQFTWTNFAAKRGDELVVRDVFETEAVTDVLSLGENQTLVIRPPDRYLVSDATVGVTNGTLVWEGARQFEPGSVSVVYRVAAPPGADLDVPLDGPTLLGALLALVAVTTVVYLTTRATRSPDGSDRAPPDGDRPGGDPGTASGGTDDVGGVDAGGDSGSVSGVGPTAPGAGEAGTDRPAPSTTGVTADAADEDGDGVPTSVARSDGRPPDAAADVELLSDEERVVRLLEANGGRMRQSHIVDRTGWSNAKVSVLLSSMAAEGRVEKLRIGRENLISLPDVDPEPEHGGSDPGRAGQDAD